MILAFLGIGTLSLLTGAFYGQLESIEAAGVKISFAKAAATTLDALDKRLAATEEASKSHHKILDTAVDGLAKLTNRVKVLEERPKRPNISLEDVEEQADIDVDIRGLRTELNFSEEKLAAADNLRQTSREAISELESLVADIPEPGV